MPIEPKMKASISHGICRWTPAISATVSMRGSTTRLMPKASQWKRIASGEEAPPCTDRCSRRSGWVRGGIVGDADVGDDHRIDADARGEVDRLPPQAELAGRRKGVDRQQHLGAALVGIGDRLFEFGRGEVEAGEVAGVGGVLQAAIDGVGAGIDGGAQARRRSRRADQFGTFEAAVSHGCLPSSASAPTARNLPARRQRTEASRARCPWRCLPCRRGRCAASPPPRCRPAP